MQHLFSIGGRNAVVWGLGARVSEDKTEGDFTISLDPAERTQRIYSAFIQDEITLVEDRLSMIVGTKVEKNNFSVNDLEWEPNVRLSWNVTDSHLLWSSVARAVRIPSRIEQNGTINGGFLPPNVGDNIYDLPLLATIKGNPELDTEDVIAYELGYRGQLSDVVQTDVSLFYNQYENLRTLAPDFFGVTCQPGGTPPAPPFPPPPASCPPGNAFVQLPILMVNGDDVETYGAEFSISWATSEALYLQGGYTYLHVEDDGTSALASAGADNPEHQFSARSLWNMSASTKADLWFRYVGALDGQGIPSYLTMDAKLSWMPLDSLELSLVGRNLLEEEHAEFREEYGASIPTEIPREVFVQLDWNF
jgi:iron complex outermembrane receptor protein